MAERLTEPEEGHQHLPDSWSRDGRTLSYTDIGPNGTDVWTLNVEAGSEPEKFAANPDLSERASSFSPDGRWIAYGAYAADFADFVVYVKPFPATAENRQITPEDGMYPVWSPAGNALFYRRASSLRDRLLTRKVTLDRGTLQVEAERELAFRADFSANAVRDYDISPDGKRFIVLLADQSDSGEPTRAQINIVQNWFEELKQRVPVK